MLEKRLRAVSPQPFTANGTINGKVTVADTRLFKVKQKIFLQSSTQPNTDGLEVKRILNRTEMLIGPEKGKIDQYSDMSAFLVADSAAIGANEQFRPSVPAEEITRAVYSEEPTVAIRSLLVDKDGNDYRTENPLPVQLSDGSINIGTVNAELETQLSHKDNYPDVGDVADSVRIGDGDDEMAVNDDGSINVVFVPGPGATAKSFYNEVSSVANAVLTTVLTYTVPAATTSKLKTIDVSGTNIATFQVEVNSTVIDKKRTYFSGPLNEVFNFDSSIALLAGDIVRVRVLHGRPNVGDFNARIAVLEQT